MDTITKSRVEFASSSFRLTQHEINTSVYTSLLLINAHSQSSNYSMHVSVSGVQYYIYVYT